MANTGLWKIQLFSYCSTDIPLQCCIHWTYNSNKCLTMSFTTGNLYIHVFNICKWNFQTEVFLFLAQSSIYAACLGSWCLGYSMHLADAPRMSDVGLEINTWTGRQSMATLRRRSRMMMCTANMWECSLKGLLSQWWFFRTETGQQACSLSSNTRLETSHHKINSTSFSHALMTQHSMSCLELRMSLSTMVIYRYHDQAAYVHQTLLANHPHRQTTTAHSLGWVA